MAKAYLITCYHSIKNPATLAAYAKIAGPAMQAAGGRFLVRGMPAKTYENGVNQRTVVVEFDSLARASPRTTALATRKRCACWATPPSATCASSKASAERSAHGLEEMY